MRMMDKDSLVKARMHQDQSWESFREWWDKIPEEEQAVISHYCLSGDISPLVTGLGREGLISMMSLVFEEIALRAQERAWTEKELDEEKF